MQYIKSMDSFALHPLASLNLNNNNSTNENTSPSSKAKYKNINDHEIVFIKRLNKEGHTIILTTHYLEEAEALCNRVAMLRGGEIVALDTTANLLRGMSGITVQISADALPPAWHARGSVQASGAWGFTLSGYAELETLLAAFREANITVREMKLGEADLEQAFLKLTSREGASA